MSVSVIELIPAILILFPIIVLLQQYRLTHSKDYIIFALGFISILLEIILDAVFHVNHIPNLDELHFSTNTYLILEKIRYINFIIPATAFYFVGRRARHQKMIDKRSSVLLVWWLICAILVLQMDLKQLPDSASIWFFEVYSTVDSGQIGAAYISDRLIIGQGFEFILIFYQTFCIGYLAYAFLRMKNVYSYDGFQRVVFLWVATLTFFIIGNIFKLLLILGVSVFSYSQIEMLQFISFLLVAIMSIVYAEGLLLTEIQINRVFKLYKLEENLDSSKSSIGSKLFSRGIDYLHHVELYYDEEKILK